MRALVGLDHSEHFKQKMISGTPTCFQYPVARNGIAKPTGTFTSGHKHTHTHKDSTTTLVSGAPLGYLRLQCKQCTFSHLFSTTGWSRHQKYIKKRTREETSSSSWPCVRPSSRVSQRVQSCFSSSLTVDLATNREELKPRSRFSSNRPLLVLGTSD